MQKYVQDILDTIVIKKHYDEYAESRVLYKDNKLFLGSFHFINDIYIKYINDMDFTSFADIIAETVYSKFSKHKDILSCISTINTLPDGTVQLSSQEYDDEKRIYKSLKQYKFIMDHAQRLCKELIKKVDNCNTLTIIDLVITDTNNMSHDTALILEKQDSKILTHFYDPHGTENSTFKYIIPLFKEIFNYDESKRLEFIPIEHTACPIGIQQFEEKLDPSISNKKGYCGFFNFLWIYCSISICLKYNLSFSKYSKEIDTELLTLFEKDRNYMLNKMCNLIENVFSEFIKDDNTKFTLAIQSNNHYNYKILNEIEIKSDPVPRIKNKLLKQKRECVDKIQYAIEIKLEIPELLEHKLSKEDIPILKDKIVKLQKYNRILDKKFQMTNKLINMAVTFVDESILQNTLENYHNEYLLKRLDNDLELLKVEYFIEQNNL